VRAFLLCVGLACFLVVVVTFQPFREVPRGRAGQQALAGSPVPLASLVPSAPGQAVLVAGTLAAASDVRRERPVELVDASALTGRRSEYALAPGTRLRDDSGEVGLEGARFDLHGSPGDYPYGSPAVAYGRAGQGEVEVWAMARDAADLEALASRQTALLDWPWLLVGLVLAAVGYGLALVGTYAAMRAIRGAPWTSPHLAGVALALYLMLGFGLLGSAWAMLWPLVGAVTLAGAAVMVLARRADRTVAVPQARRRRGRSA
jgi:hypothetical protein